MMRNKSANLLGIIVGPISRAAQRNLLPPSSPRIFEVLKERAIEESADFIVNEMPTALIFSNREKLWDYTLSKISMVEGLVIECGVHSGYSIRYIANRLNPNQEIHGFDSFEGLKNDWVGTDLEAGYFNLDGILPKVPNNVILHKGWFDQTLPLFVSERSGKIKLLHLDGDTYESAKTSLEILKELIKPGTIIIFDELIGYHGWKQGEFKAWKEFVISNNVEYEYLAASDNQVSVMINEISTK